MIRYCYTHIYIIVIGLSVFYTIYQFTFVHKMMIIYASTRSIVVFYNFEGQANESNVR